MTHPRLVCFTVVAGFWGLGFTPALRKMFILRLAKPLGLTFPGGTAAALTIRTLHATEDGGRQVKENLKVMLSVLSGSLVWAVSTSYAPGILYTWNPFWWIYKWGGERRHRCCQLGLALMVLVAGLHRHRHAHQHERGLLPSRRKRPRLGHTGTHHRRHRRHRRSRWLQLQLSRLGYLQRS